MKLREMFGGAVAVLDEASMVSTDQMRSLMRIAEGLGVARLVLVGDTRQLRAVDAGQPFRQLQQAGMTTATMDDILRQKNPALRQAVLAALAGEPAEAVEMLENGIVEVEHDELAEKAAETWLALDREARDGTLLLAPTHALREEINRTVRDALAEEGVLRGRTLTVDRLVNLGMTRAERGDVRNYREGDELVFNQDLLNYRLRKDEILTVTGVERDRVTLMHPDGGPRRIRPAGPVRYRFDVYETRPIEIRAGDRIRWTRNDRARTLINGEKAEVTEIARGRVRLLLEDGRAVSLAEDDPQLRHIDHAWRHDGSRRAGLDVGPGDRGSGFEPPGADRPVDVLRGDQPGAVRRGCADRQSGAAGRGAGVRYRRTARRRGKGSPNGTRPTRNGWRAR